MPIIGGINNPSEELNQRIVQNSLFAHFWNMLVTEMMVDQICYYL
ncbi:11723_t:CDS:2 [Cetraspora pellucida]|uniref:11723_t:CDS:1 n=1 Tax=Cetraspora pellucida TaxID=1433469 RepID=A0ACA9K2Q5_9GLOM|nr:11723_t:CDS:2 [Cetraspora pellucida]